MLNICLASIKKWGLAIELRSHTHSANALKGRSRHADKSGQSCHLRHGPAVGQLETCNIDQNVSSTYRPAAPLSLMCGSVWTL